MATPAALRRAPWAAAATAARGLLGAMSVSRVPPPHRRFPYRAERSALLSSLSAAPQPGAAADAHLLRAIKYEISCAQQDCKKRDWAKELGEWFPFEIQDKEGTTRIILTRRDQKEQIEVEVFLPSAADPVEHNGEQKDDTKDDDCQARAISGLASAGGENSQRDDFVAGDQL